MMGVFGIVPLPPMGIRLQQAIIAKYAVILLVAFFLIKNKWLQAFLAYCVVNVTLMYSPSASGTLQALCFFLIMYQVLVDNLNKDRITILLDTLCLIGVIQSGMMILQYNGIWWLIQDAIHTGRGNITGITSNPNIASAMLALCIPAFLRKGKFIFLPFLLSALVINKGLQGILCTAIILTIYFSSKLYIKNRFIFIGLALSAVGLWLWRSGEWMTFTRYDRLPIWWFSVRHLVPVKPIIGCGLGNGHLLYPVIAKFCHVTEAFTHPHNEFIFLLLETGVLGFGLVLGFLVCSIKRFCFVLNGEKLNILFGVIATIFLGFVGFPYHVTIGIICLVYLAIMEYQNRGENV